VDPLRREEAAVEVAGRGSRDRPGARAREHHAEARGSQRGERVEGDANGLVRLVYRPPAERDADRSGVGAAVAGIDEDRRARPPADGREHHAGSPREAGAVERVPERRRARAGARRGGEQDGRGCKHRRGAEPPTAADARKPSPFPPQSHRFPSALATTLPLPSSAHYRRSRRSGALC
jgi:hypothetical protein